MKFSVEQLDIEGVLLIRAQRQMDARGYFMETWTRDAFANLGIDADFVQDNQSFSTAAGTVRGLHFQRAPFEQAKLARVLYGATYNVAVDLRVGSRTFGCWCAATLEAKFGHQLFIPRGFAHGFMTLEVNTTFFYKVDAPYAPDFEGGIYWNDPQLSIHWPFNINECTLSDRDRSLGTFAKYCGVE